MPTQEVTPIRCPQCQTPYTSQVTSIIDVGQNPMLKNTLLSGQLNLSECPSCGYNGPLSLPLLYHDPDKELALVLVPSELNLPHLEEQKIIGDLSNRLMNELQPEQRRSYLFTPKTFLTQESFIKAILAADGITEEMIQAQEAKMGLLNQLLQIEQEADFNQFIKTNEAELDYQFFELLTATALQAANMDDQQTAQGFLALRQQIAQQIEHGAEILKQLDEESGLNSLTPKNLLVALQEAETEADFLELVRMGKPLLDYAFFQNLTAQINDNPSEADKLITLRTRILDASSKIDEETRSLMAQANTIIDQMLQASDPTQLILDNISIMDENFLSILSSYIEEARQKEQPDRAEQLTALGQKIVNTIQAQMPPELKLLNELMQAESQEAFSTLLQQNKNLITSQFIEVINEVQKDFQQQGQMQAVQFMNMVKEQAQQFIL